MWHLLATRRRVQREHNDRAWLAYHTAVLPHLKGGFPPLKSLVVDVDSSHRRQSPQSMLAALKGWVAVLA